MQSVDYRKKDTVKDPILFQGWGSIRHRLGLELHILRIHSAQSVEYHLVLIVHKPGNNRLAPHPTPLYIHSL
jgi:hypothetical protein